MECGREQSEKGVFACVGHKLWISGGLEWIRQMNRCGNQLKTKNNQKQTMRPSPINTREEAIEETKGALSLRFNYSLLSLKQELNFFVDQILFWRIEGWG